MSIMEDVQSLDLGTIVELYEVDLTVIGYADILYFTASEGNAKSIWFGGDEYVSRGIEMTGFSRSSNDAPPEPTLTISNVDQGGNALLLQYDNLIGAKVTRRRTLAKYLDRLEDGVTPNPNASFASQFMPEIWYIEQKEEGNPILIKWRMDSIMNLDGKMVPNRRVLKTFCERNYRFWDEASNSFIYPATRACPYAGASCFDQFNQPTTNANDECDKSHVGCGKRFGDGLPTWAMPGADRLPG